MSRFWRRLSFSTSSVVLLVVFVGGGCSRQAGRSGQAHLENGLVKLRQENFKGAAKQLEKAVKQLPGNINAHCHLGIAYWKLGKLEHAVEPLRRAAALDKNDPRPLEFLGHVFMDMKEWEEARKVFALAYERSPLAARILTSRALVAFHMGKTKLAHSFLMQALDLEPDYPPALDNVKFLTLATSPEEDKSALIKADSSAVAEAATEKSAASINGVRDKPDQRPLEVAVTPAPATSPDQSLKRPSAQSGIASAKTADPQIKEQGEIQPPKVPVSPQKRPSSRLLATARNAIKHEKLDEALIALNQAIKQDPGNSDALWELALLYDKHLEYEDSAARTYRQFRQLFPDDPRARQKSAAPVQKVRSYRQPPLPMLHSSPRRKQKTRRDRRVDIDAPRGQKQARNSSSETSLGRLKTETTERHRDAALKIWAEGLQCHHAKDWDGAIDRYKRALELDGTLINASYNLGLAYKARGDLVPARDAFIRTLKLNTGMIKAHYMLGVVYRGLKENGKAVEQLNQALRVKPDYAKAHYMLGLVYRKEQRFDMAKIHFERYLDLAPDEPLAARTRQWLQKNAVDY